MPHPSLKYPSSPLATAAWALVLGALALTGCSKPAGVIFPPPATPLVWPGPPDPPRIAYVGQIATSDDLKPARNFFEAVGETLFGKKDIHRMLSPYGTCTDGQDRLFVADSNGQMVHMFDLNTRRYQQWRPTGTADRFTQPVAVAWDSAAARLLVADSLSGSIFAFASDGKTLGQLGAGILQRPCGLAIDPATRRIFVADITAHQVVILSPDGQLLQRIGQRGAQPGQFNYPTHLVLDSTGRLYVSDSLNFRVQQFSPELKFLRQIGSQGDMPGYFSQPKGIAVDREDHLYVVDARFENVQIFNSEGALLLYFGGEGTGPGEFWLPAGLFIDSRNRLWIADSYNRRVQVLDYLPELKP